MYNNLPSPALEHPPTCCIKRSIVRVGVIRKDAAVVVDSHLGSKASGSVVED